MPVDTSKPDRVIITHGTSTAEVYLYGATLTSWKADAIERLFVSKKALLDGSKAVRGGIPLVFPHFGTIPTSKLPQHGFARNSKWDWVGTATDSKTETQVQFGLASKNVPEKLRELWPHDFKLTYTVTLTATTLTTKLTIKNPSATAWDFTTLLHTYFAVANIKSAAVTGLTGTTFNDKVDPPATATSAKPTESRRGVTVAGEVDRVYEGVENDHVAVTGTGIGGGAVVVYKNGFPDVVVWNPWTDKAKAMADFGDEEYNNMICVEVGSVADMISLAGGATWEGSQTLVAI